MGESEHSDLEDIEFRDIYRPDIEDIDNYSEEEIELYASAIIECKSFADASKLAKSYAETWGGSFRVSHELASDDWWCVFAPDSATAEAVVCGVSTDTIREIRAQDKAAEATEAFEFEAKAERQLEGHGRSGWYKGG